MGEKQRQVVSDQIKARKQEYDQLSNNVKLQAQSDARALKAQESYNRALAKTEDMETKRQQQKSSAEASRQQKQSEAELRRAQQEQEQYVQNIANKFANVVGRFALNTLKNQWQEAISYATEYYDALNEIRTVTMKSESESNKMGENFRKIAKEMKVSSTEVAQAAVTFYRQG